jgi:hypothetical protein
MAKKAIYAPGELDRVRNKLGPLDPNEAKRMASLLGGEVGVEKSEDKAPQKPRPRVRHESVDMVVGGRGGRSGSSLEGTRPKRAVEVVSEGGEGEEPVKKNIARKLDPHDDPSVPVRPSYFERVKIDKFAGQMEFDIKSPGQVLYSIISVFGIVPDYVNPVFITKRMGEYYKRIELLVVSTRTLFPRNNAKRNQRLKKVSPFIFSILDTIRYWNIERITQDLARLQSHPRNVKTSDFSDILRSVYKPLFILEKLDTEVHIKGAFKVLYKILILENPTEEKGKFQDLIRTAINSYIIVKRDIYFFLYPLLMKILSDRFLPYERFFIERKNRYMAFLGVTEDDQILPIQMNADEKYGQENANEEIREETNAENEAEDESESETEEKKAQRMQANAELKALDRGLATLEALFPQAGWDKISSFPDMYPYFADILDLKKGYELIAPTDPLLVMAILMRILEELFFGLRYVSFGVVTGADGNPDRVGDVLGTIINNWQIYIDISFNKEYLPRLKEYVRILDSNAESRTSNYAKRILNDLHWAKRLYFLPYYKFESIFPPSIQKKEIDSLYPEIRKLRKYLTAVAAGIEQGNKQGGAEKRAPCDGIDNPWEPYVFQVPNPLSRRLDALLGDKKRNNATLVFFTLAVTTVLDYMINNDSSWAYGKHSSILFRSVDNEGVRPLTGVDTKIDADAIFKQVLKQRKEQAAGNQE